MQVPGTTPPAEPAPPASGSADAQATLEQTQAAETLSRQQLTNDVEQRLDAARQLMNTGQPEMALNVLRITLSVVRSNTTVPEADRQKLERRIQAQMISTAQAEERVVAERAEHLRLEAAAEQRTRAIDLFQRNKETIGAMMVQFDTLISEGVYNVLYNGGTGDIRAATEPFFQARLLAQKAYALQRGAPLPYSDNDPAPAAGEAVGNSMRFLGSGIAVPQAQVLPLSAHHVRRHPGLGPVPRQPVHRVSRSRLVPVHLGEADQAVGQGGGPVRSRPQDQADPGEARRADLDVVRQ